MIERADAVACAVSYVKTPYVLGGRVKGAGVDCASLIACYLTETGLATVGELGLYTSDWFLHSSSEKYLLNLMRHAPKTIEAIARGTVDAKPGSIVLFKVANSRLYNHGGIITKWPMMVHACDPCVKESNLTSHPMTGFRQMAIFDPWERTC